MIITAHTGTREILGYATIGGSLDTEFLQDSEVVFSWGGVIPEPRSNYQLGSDNASVVLKSQSLRDSEANALMAIYVRAERDRLLRESDYTQISDSTHPGSKAAWATYRTNLRSIPQQSGFPNTITWPTQPE